MSSYSIQNNTLVAVDTARYRIYPYLCPRDLIVLDDTEYLSHMPKHKATLYINLSYMSK